MASVAAYLGLLYFISPLLRGAIDRGPLTAFYVLGALAAYAWVGRGGRMAVRPLDLAAAGVVAAGALSLLWTVFPAGTVEVLLTLLLYLLVYLLLAHAVPAADRLRVAGWALAGGVLGATIGLVSYWVSPDSLPFHRPGGTFEYPNAFAQHALFLYLGAAGVAAAGGRWRWLAPAAAILFGSWLLTLSRGSQYTLVPGLLATCLLLPSAARRRWACFVGVTALAGFVLAGALLVGQPAARREEGRALAVLRHTLEHLQAIRIEDPAAPVPPRATIAGPGQAIVVHSSVAGRFSFWVTALRMIAARPWLGFGLGSFPRVYPAYQADPAFFSISAHNHYLQWWAETGLLGVVALATLGGLTCVALWRRIGRADGLLAGSAGGLAALALHLAVDVNAEIPAVMLLFWGGLAVIRGESALLERGPRRPFALAVAAALACLSALPYFGALRMELGRTSLAAGDLSPALGHFEAAGRLNPLDPGSRAFQAHAHLLAWRSTGDRQRLERAVRLAERSVRLDPHNPPARNQLGLMYAERAAVSGNAADGQRAREELGRAVELFPWWAEYRYSLAYVRWHQGDAAGALGELEPVLAREVDFRRPIPPWERDRADALFADVRVLAALGRRAAGDLAAARRLAEEALQLAPGHADARRLVQYLDADEPR
jgi:tetratricopeptide (TPR) repeat protein